jgi:16S rRNA (cytidine1402-2'-O)-methyltransferase
MPPKGSQPRAKRPSFPDCSSGTLYIVGVPIGHPDDITIRALDTLRTVSIVASENPQSTQTLLAHHDITTVVTSYGPRQLQDKISLLLHRLMQGQDVALVSDCGMPVILDPGHLLVHEAHVLGIPIRVVPGPSALTAAVALSGFSGDAITIEGPSPNRPHFLTALISRIRQEPRTCVLYTDSRRLTRTLEALAKRLPARAIAIALNLTKPDETILRGTALRLLKDMRFLPKEAHVTLVIEGHGLEPDGKAKERRRKRASRLYGGGS